MASIQACAVPAGTLLRRYMGGAGYADCYVAEVPGSVSQAAFVEAFYTSGLFKIERTLLRILASHPASDAEAKQLAQGAASAFSAWRVESQSAAELLLADMTGRTKSWLMALPAPAGVGGVRTYLYFGSAVLPGEHRGAQRPAAGVAFKALLGFHKLYSRLLLQAARGRVLRARGPA